MSDGKGTEPEKRKAGSSDVAGGSQKRPRDGSREETAVTEEEVEEFFAILRRIHVAVNYFKSSNGGNRHLTEGRSLALQLEINDTDDDTVKPAEDVKVNTGFDLNADPDTDPDPGPV